VIHVTQSAVGSRLVWGGFGLQGLWVSKSGRSTSLAAPRRGRLVARSVDFRFAKIVTARIVDFCFAKMDQVFRPSGGGSQVLVKNWSFLTKFGKNGQNRSKVPVTGQVFGGSYFYVQLGGKNQSQKRG